MLLIRDLRATQGDFSLHFPLLELQAGEIGAVLGESGSGKSTLLNALAGFIPCEGEILLDSKPLHLLPSEKRQMPILFQRPALFPQMSVKENIGFSLRAQGKPRSAQLQAATYWLNRIKIEALADRLPHEISEGQAQRVAMARALAAECPVLLLDEPFSALDPATRMEMRTLLKQVTSEKSLHVVWVTHHPEDAEAISDKTWTLSHGRVVP